MLKIIFLLTHVLYKILYQKDYVRVLNYHGTPSDTLENFEKQLLLYSTYFQLCNLEDAFFGADSKKPKLVVTFDDGLKSNLQAVEKCWKIGNFLPTLCVPAILFSNEEFDSDSLRLSSDNGGKSLREDFLCSSDINRISAEIACHTYSHKRFSSVDTCEVLDTEVLNSKVLLESVFSKRINVFCYPGGETESYTDSSMKLVMSNYRISLMTFAGMSKQIGEHRIVGRINIESNLELKYVFLKLSLLVDVWHYLRRRKIMKLGRRYA